MYTDGSALGNPGPGGYGVVLMSGPYRKELSCGYAHSKYVVDAVAKGWVFGWERKGFKDKKNPDLWRRFLSLYRRHNVRFVWVKGHAEIPENERCDRLAVAASSSGDLIEDTGYRAGEAGSLL